nr:MAG TPA: hypothetical protein [Caudoviricetes sp.]
MLNVVPQITGIFVARHLKISYSAGLDLAYIAFWSDFRIDRDTSNRRGERGRRMLFLRAKGFTIRLKRLHDRLEVRTRRDGQAPEVIRDLRDMREVLNKVRSMAENYQRSRLAWWAVVPINQYRFIQFL